MKESFPNGFLLLAALMGVDGNFNHVLICSTFPASARNPFEAEFESVQRIPQNSLRQIYIHEMLFRRFAMDSSVHYGDIFQQSNGEENSQSTRDDIANHTKAPPFWR